MGAPEDEAVVPVVHQHPAKICRVFPEMRDHLPQRGVGRAGRAVPPEQAHRPTVAVHALEPLDAGDTLRETHRVGLYERVGLHVEAL